MAKAILVLNKMPETCGDCRLINANHIQCKWDGFIHGVSAGGKPPIDCPLRPMPERVRMTVEQAVEQGMDRDNLMRCHGWNACLDAIDGDEK